MNTGAHYRTDPLFKTYVDYAIYYVNLLYPNMMVIFRNTVEGHLKCWEHNTPLEVKQDPLTLPYMWGLFHDQNKIVYDKLEESRFYYLDVETATSMRGLYQNFIKT